MANGQTSTALCTSSTTATNAVAHQLALISFRLDHTIVQVVDTIMIVIDTSAILAVLLDEPERLALIDATHGAQLCAPASLPWEVCNALSAALKRRRLALSQAVEILRNFGKIPLQLIPVDLVAALEIAAEFQIYAYDAFVLELARAQQCSLLTLDRGVQRIARASRIELIEV